MHLFAIIANLRFQDILDVFFLTIVAYHLYLWFRGTKALKALVGLLGLGIIFTVARTWGLFLTTWVFQILWQVLVILLIILFQSEIRQVLERVNPLQVMGLHKISKPEKWISGFTQAIFALAKRKIGALVIIERGDSVREFITEGQPLEGESGPELLMSIFQKGSPLHDGAMLIRRGRVTQVACYLPLSPDEGLPKEWGSRHRAALGLSERCDAWVVVVSEERAEVSLAREKEMVHVGNTQELSQLILEAITPISPPRKSWWERIYFLLVHRWHAKVGTLFLIGFIWLMLAGQQDFETTVSVPLGITNIPPPLEILDPVNPMVEIKVRGLRKDASTLNQKNVIAEIDLSLARLGRRTFSITRDHIRLPNDRIYVVNIDPPQLKFKFRGKPDE
jgi:uncharacterized protein (TIGR00159 family)